MSHPYFAYSHAENNYHKKNNQNLETKSVDEAVNEYVKQVNAVIDYTNATAAEFEEIKE